jgi:hypothetical protein
MRRSAPGRTGRWKFGQEVSSALVELTQFFHVLASLAQMERELIVERPRAGLDAARRQGRVGGRRREMTESKVEAARKLLASGTPAREVASGLGISVPTTLTLKKAPTARDRLKRLDLRQYYIHMLMLRRDILNAIIIKVGLRHFNRVRRICGPQKEFCRNGALQGRFGLAGAIASDLRMETAPAGAVGQRAKRRLKPCCNRSLFVALQSTAFAARQVFEREPNTGRNPPAARNLLQWDAWSCRSQFRLPACQ